MLASYLPGSWPVGKACSICCTSKSISFSSDPMKSLAETLPLTDEGGRWCRSD